MKTYEVNILNNKGEIMTSSTFTNADEALKAYEQDEKAKLCQFIIDYNNGDTDEYKCNYKIMNGVYCFADRKQYILNQCVKYLKELLCESEKYNILHEVIGLNDEEMQDYGFDVEEIKKHCKE